MKAHSENSLAGGDRSTSLPGRLLSWCLPVGVLWGLAICSLLPWADSWFLTFGQHGLFSPLLHFESNAYLMWPNPLFSVLPQGQFGYGLYLSCLVLLITCSAAMLVNRREAVAAAVAVLLLVCFGCNVVVLSSAAVFSSAVALFGIERFALSRVGCLLLGALAGVCAVGLTSHAAFLLLLCGAIAAARTSAKTVAEVGFSQQLLLRTSALSVAFIALLLLPSIQFPDYPQKSHVVQGYGVVEGLQPLLGSEPPLLVINRTALREQLANSSPILFCAAFSMLVFVGFCRAPAKRLASLGLVLAVALLLESAIFAIGISQIAPLQSFSRLVPEQVFLPLTTIAFALAVLCLLLSAAVILQRKAGFVLVVSMGLAGIVLARGESPLLSFDVTTTRSLLDELKQIGDPFQRSRLQDRLLSPSFAVYGRFGLQDLASRESISQTQVRTPLPVDAEVTSSLRSDLLPLLRDGKPDTRWSPSIGRQVGGEWLAIRFAEPLSVVGVEIGTGPFYTDFPRGVEVRTAESCADPAAIARGGELLVREDPWEGPVIFSPSGYPAFDSQYDIRVLFSAPRLVRCLVVVQSGRGASFDWSVSELSLFSSAPKEDGR